MDLLGELARTGLLGTILALVIFYLVRKDGELAKEREARLQDAKDMANLVKSMTAATVQQTATQEHQNVLLSRLVELHLTKKD